MQVSSQKVVAKAGLSDTPWWADETTQRVLGQMASSAPYLRGLMLREPERLGEILQTPLDETLRKISQELTAPSFSELPRANATQSLRRAKHKAGLLLAIAEIGGARPVTDVIRHWSEFADQTVSAALAWVFANPAKTTEQIKAVLSKGSEASGYFVLAMGKHGAFELNYSSDIDLVVFFDAQLHPEIDRYDLQQVFVRLTRDMCKLLSDQTADGYVFRTDLRLRPDPGSTQVAITTDAAFHYYESVGQNWERAAFIKARPCGGDNAAGLAFLKELEPYIWRRHLDHAAIADVHAMKRQIRAHKGFLECVVPGHNIKLGRGGIREIEFFAQTQQLVAGGRQPVLRTKQTLKALTALAEFGWIENSAADELAASYCLLRHVENLIQATNDQQTHIIPADDEARTHLAHLCGFATLQAFDTAVLSAMETVVAHDENLFPDSKSLSVSAGALVFTGEKADPETMQTIEQLGFENPEGVINTVKAWHFGRYRATATAKAREALTEFTPSLLQTLARSQSPNGALIAFDRLLQGLPTGFQFFTLLQSKPELLELVAEILGSAPRLAELLSRHPHSLDALLDPSFFHTGLDSSHFESAMHAALDDASDYEAVLNAVRGVANEQHLLVGARILSGTISATDAGRAFADLADACVSALLTHTQHEIEKAHGTFANAEGDTASCAVLALGKWGSQEMTSSSDLDMIMVYRVPDGVTASNGARPLAPSEYFARLTKRLITALTARLSSGQLYEIDTRLRPSGGAGPVASNFDAFATYHATEAWTWEHMALTRARVLGGGNTLADDLETLINTQLRQPRDEQKTLRDAAEMRERIADAKPASNIWDLKTSPGGIIDLEFIAQTQQLIHAADQPACLARNTGDALRALTENGAIQRADGNTLIEANDLYAEISQILKLSIDGDIQPDTFSPGLAALLTRVGDHPDVSTLEAELSDKAQAVRLVYDAMIPPHPKS